MIKEAKKVKGSSKEAIEGSGSQVKRPKQQQHQRKNHNVRRIMKKTLPSLWYRRMRGSRREISAADPRIECLEQACGDDFVILTTKLLKKNTGMVGSNQKSRKSPPHFSLRFFEPYIGTRGFHNGQWFVMYRPSGGNQ